MRYKRGDKICPEGSHVNHVLLVLNGELNVKFTIDYNKLVEYQNLSQENSISNDPENVKFNWFGQDGVEPEVVQMFKSKKLKHRMTLYTLRKHSSTSKYAQLTRN